MTASASSQLATTTFPEYHSSETTTEEQRIRVAKERMRMFTSEYIFCIKDVPGGWSMYPHSVVQELIELTGKRPNVFLVVWEATVAYWENEKEIPMKTFVKKCECTDRTVQAAIKWLVENEWLEITERPGRCTIYGVTLKFMKKHLCVKLIAPEDRFGGYSEDEKMSQQPPPIVSGVSAPVSILSLKKEEEEEPTPKPDQPVVSTGGKNDAKSDQVSGSGSYKIVGNENFQMVREMIRFEVNKSVVMKAMEDQGEKWVRRIYNEFNRDVGNDHNMNNPPAVLAKRLQDYDETWRKAEKAIAKKRKWTGDLPDDRWDPDIDKNLLAEYQRLVYKQYDDETAHRGYIWDVLVDFKNKAHITLKQAIELLDFRGASREDLYTWWIESREVSK